LLTGCNLAPNFKSPDATKFDYEAYKRYIEENEKRPLKSDENKEICSFKHYMTEKKINIKNPIFVMDRAYYCYDLFNYFLFLCNPNNQGVYLIFY
jgi:hypothetical protein